LTWRKSHHADQNQEFIEHRSHIFHVRFTPKRDMCDGLADVCFGPIGDIEISANNYLPPPWSQTQLLQHGLRQSAHRDHGRIGLDRFSMCLIALNCMD